MLEHGHGYSYTYCYPLPLLCFFLDLQLHHGIEKRFRITDLKTNILNQIHLLQKCPPVPSSPSLLFSQNPLLCYSILYTFCYQGGPYVSY